MRLSAAALLFDVKLLQVLLLWGVHLSVGSKLGQVSVTESAEIRTTQRQRCGMNSTSTWKNSQPITPYNIRVTQFDPSQS